MSDKGIPWGYSRVIDPDRWNYDDPECLAGHPLPAPGKTTEDRHGGKLA